MKSFLSLLVILLAGCDQGAWNNPYPASESNKPIYYDMFMERPKHLDPVTAYSADEYTFIAQIYEPPLQYHFLKRPYELTTLTAESVPEPAHYDEADNKLAADVAADDVAYSVYRIRINPGIHYQPHPAFAKDKQGNYLYHDLTRPDLEDIRKLAGFENTGTRELTAADYVYQIKRMANPRLQSPIAGLMSKYIVGLPELMETLQGRPVAMDESRFLDLREYELPGAKVIDKYTFEIRINGKYPQFVYWLAMPFFSPMPWEAERFYNQPGMSERNIVLDWYPVGTGPFMLTENNPNLRMVMERNPNFRGEPYPAEGLPEDGNTALLADAGKPMPFIDKAVYSLENETIPAWNKFLQGYYDVSTVSSDSFDQAVRFNAHGNAVLTPEMKEKGINLASAVTVSTYYMGFNMLDPVVGGYDKKSRLLRRAISIAVDFEEFISIFQNGRGIASQGPIPPGIFGYREGREGMNPYVYDWKNGATRKSIDKARELLAEAGYPNGRDKESGEPLILYYDTLARGPDSKALNNWFIKQFDKLGIRLVVRSTDYNRFREKMRKGTAQIYMWGWNADYPDPENFLFLLYGPNGKVQHGGENSSNYANPEFDRLFEQMRNTENSPQRQAIIDRMVEIARRDAPWLWGFHPVSFSLYHEWYRNAEPNLMANNTLKYKRINADLRQEKRRSWNDPILWPVLTVFAVVIVAFVPAIVVYRRRERSSAI